MKNKLTLSISILFNSLLHAQCTVEINSPTVAISNCSGPILTASSIGTGPFTYLWSTSGGGSFSPSTTSTSPMYSEITPGLVVVSLIGTDSLGCTSFDTDTIEFISPVDTFYRQFCTYPDTICPLQCPLVSTINWTFTDTTGSSSSITADGAGCVSANAPGTYEQLAIYSTACTVMHTYVVNNPCMPLCNLNAGPDIAVCNYTSYSLNAIATPAGSGWTYTWSPADININDASIANPVFFAPAGDYSYIITAFNSISGCTAIDTLNIHVFGYVETFDKYSCSFPYTLCPIAESILSTAISWSPLGTAVGNCNTVAGPGTYTFNGIYSGGCTVVHTYIVTDTCAPTTCSISINTTNYAISNCIGPLLSAMAIGSEPFNYSWSVSSPGSLSTPSSSSTNISSTSPGDLTVSVFAYDSTFCTAYDTAIIHFISPTDTFNVYPCTLPDTICPLPITMASFLNWTYYDSTGTSNSVTPIAGNCAVANVTGDYVLFSIYETSCPVQHTYRIMDSCSTTGIIKADENQEIGFYPNPANNKIVLNNRNIITAVNILSVSGEYLYKDLYPKNNIVDLTSFTNGIYLVQIKSNSRNKVSKLIINR